MTAKLLPVFIQCFDDKFSSVRMEACITCSNLNITDEQILMKLVSIVQKDPVWKIKALAIQGLIKYSDINSHNNNTNSDLQMYVSNTTFTRAPVCSLMFW